MRYERPELRFTLRDGARFAAYLQSMGVDATKLLIGAPSVDAVTKPRTEAHSAQPQSINSAKPQSPSPSSPCSSPQSPSVPPPSLCLKNNSAQPPRPNP